MEPSPWNTAHHPYPLNVALCRVLPHSGSPSNLEGETPQLQLHYGTSETYILKGWLLQIGYSDGKKGMEFTIRTIELYERVPEDSLKIHVKD